MATNKKTNTESHKPKKKTFEYSNVNAAKFSDKAKKHAEKHDKKM